MGSLVKPITIHGWLGDLLRLRQTTIRDQNRDLSGRAVRGKRVPFSRSCGIARPDPPLVVPAQDVGLADENEFLTAQIDRGRSVFLVEDLIARFEDRGIEDLFLFPFGFTSPLLFRCFPAPLPHGQDLSFYWFLLGRVGDDHPPDGLFLGLRRFDQYPIL